jgi:hypothetical protein
MKGIQSMNKTTETKATGERKDPAKLPNKQKRQKRIKQMQSRNFHLKKKKTIKKKL